jgi:hypothetical protein
LDIKDFDVYDFDPSNDHVSSDTIVCHQSPCDPKDDVFAFVYDSIPYSNSQLSDYHVTFKNMSKISLSRN